MSYLRELGVLAMPPRKKIQLSNLHYFIILMLMLHFGVFVLFGLRPHPKVREIEQFPVKLVRMNDKIPPETDPDDTSGKLTTTETSKGGKGKETDNTIIKKKPAAPEIKKVTPPPAIKLPAADYPTVKPDSQYPVFRIVPGADSGLPSDEGDGNLPGFDGNGTDFGNGDDRGGPEKSGGEMADGGTRPWVYWGYVNNVVRGETREDKAANYQKAENTPPFLADAVVPDYRKLIGIGKGTVTFEVTIPAADAFPERGIAARNLRVVKVDAEYGEMREKMASLAQWCVESSGWYPAKRNGEVVEETITFELVFYGSYTEE